MIYSVCMPISRSWALVAFALACVEGADGSCRCGLFGQCGPNRSCIRWDGAAGRFSVQRDPVRGGPRAVTG